MQQFQPVTRLIGFLQSDLQFGNEIRLSVGVLRFTDIGTDGGTASADLTEITDSCFSFKFFTRPMIETAKSIDCTDSWSLRNISTSVFFVLNEDGLRPNEGTCFAR